MKEINFSITKWTAWAPELECQDDWRAWSRGEKSMSDDVSARPLVDNIPAMQRRKLSNLTKMSLQISLECTKGLGDVESVFASRYGEWSQTLKLLRSISAKEDVSPAGFSMSVHNTAAGIYSILDNNTASYTAIAANEATFEMALIEALGKLETQKNVLLIVAEEAIPEMYDEVFPEKIKPHAVGLLLEKGDVATANETFKIMQSGGESALVHVLDFLKWFLQKDSASIKTPLFEVCRV